MCALPQVHDLLQAVDEDEIGTHAKGAKDRVVEASNVALVDIKAASTE